jgi:hypothetical protein
MLLVESTVTRPPTYEGTTRDAVVSVLGAPKHTRFTASGIILHDNVELYRSDEYRTSRLVQLPGDKYYYEWNQYPIAFILTLGLIEVFVLPITAVDLGIKSFQKDQLSFHYNEADELINYSRDRKYRTMADENNKMQNMRLQRDAAKAPRP